MVTLADGFSFMVTLATSVTNGPGGGQLRSGPIETNSNKNEGYFLTVSIDGLGQRDQFLAESSKSEVPPRGRMFQSLLKNVGHGARGPGRSNG